MKSAEFAVQCFAGKLLIAFDLIELDGENLRRSPIEHRKRILAKLVRRPHRGIVLNEVFEGDGHILFEHACKLGCEGIVSKRLGSLYRSGRSPHWVKIKNPKAPAVTREAEEDWGHNDGAAPGDTSRALTGGLGHRFQYLSCSLATPGIFYKSAIRVRRPTIGILHCRAMLNPPCRKERARGRAAWAAMHKRQA